MARCSQGHIDSFRVSSSKPLHPDRTSTLQHGLLPAGDISKTGRVRGACISADIAQWPRAVQRGGERYVDSSPAGGSANLAPHMPSAQSAGIPLLDLLQKEVSHADKARRAAPADCVFSREVRCQ